MYSFHKHLFSYQFHNFQYTATLKQSEKKENTNKREGNMRWTKRQHFQINNLHDIIFEIQIFEKSKGTYIQRFGELKKRHTNIFYKEDVTITE